MSERILKALMQLFAIVAKVNLNEDEIRADQSSDSLSNFSYNKIYPMS